MRKKWLIASVSIFLLVVIYFLYARFIAEPILVRANSLPAFDVSNPNEVVGWSDHVFIGKVKEKTGEDGSSGIPTTQFSVEVLHNIKGKLGKEATVSQFAGHVMKGIARYFVIDETDIFIEGGKMYLFAGRVSASGEIGLVIGAGNQLITEAKDIPSIIAAMEEAEKNQILNPDEARLQN